VNLRLNSSSQHEIEQLASAAAVPLLVVDYTAIIERYQGLSVDAIAELLEDESELLACLQLPRQLGTSEDWIRLYGFPIDDEAPDLVVRRFTSARYPDLRKNLVAQFLAPFRGVAEIRTEHTVPTLAGDVTVRSHWKAPVVDGVPDYSRIVIVDLDVSDLRDAERSLAEAIESKDRLMATVAHELRNPLTSVVGFSSILASDWESMDDETRRQMAEDIHDQVGDMASLLDDFLSFNVTENQHVDDEPLSVGEILLGVDLDGVNNTIDETQIVMGDALRIRQIIRNLVRNAQIHGGTSVRLESTRDEEEETVAIQVIDDGPGVPGDVLESLFQPFSHGARSGSLGLGLAVSRKLARTMGGDLTHRREAGSTVFELALRPGPAD
jgi:signal transduction histidine kinase